MDTHDLRVAEASSPGAHSREEAEVEEIVHALRAYRVLTRARLREVCRAAQWSDAGFEHALAHAVSTGRVRRLGDDLYEIEPSVEAVRQQLRRS
jgi:hypothetical protein